jgi:hypothetical protein
MNILILAASVLLAWDANPGPDLAGYKIHVGIQSLTAGNPPSQVLNVGNVTQSEVQGTSQPSISLSPRRTTTRARKRILQRGHVHSYAAG